MTLIDVTPLEAALGPGRLADGGLGLVFEGPTEVVDGQTTPYLDGVLQDPALREAFFSLVDEHGLIVCRHLAIDPAPYRPVGGKRSQCRMSQGEFYHHDGCSTPTKPRIVEIRCPPQHVVRTMATSIARFHDVVSAMLLELSPALRRSGGLEDHAAAVARGGSPSGPWDQVQGIVNRVIRQLPAEEGRAYFQRVDLRAGAFFEPWALGESRFMANSNPQATVQHRRACHPPWRPGTPNGGLLKRWPNEEL